MKVAFKKGMNMSGEIDAPPDALWRAMVDFDQLPRWNPVVRRLGCWRLVPDGLLEGRAFRIKVLNAEPNRELRWHGEFLLPGLLHDESVFNIVSLDGQQAWLALRQVFTGLLAPLCGRIAETNARDMIKEIEQKLGCERSCEPSKSL